MKREYVTDKDLADFDVAVKEAYHYLQMDTDHFKVCAGNVTISFSKLDNKA